MQELFQQLANGIAWGSIYALIALGYTMVYGILRLINFAHGDVYMVGAFAAYYIASATGAGGARASLPRSTAGGVGEFNHHAAGPVGPRSC